MSIAVGFDGDVFKMRVPFAMNAVAKGAPHREWDKKNKVWVLENNERNRRYLKKNIDQRFASEKAWNEICSDPPPVDHGHWPADWHWVWDPMKHQEEAVRWGWPIESVALFHEMGLGKTFTFINLAAARMAAGYIDGLLVICPTSIKDVWAREVAAVSPIPMEVHVHESGKQSATRNFILRNHPYSVLVVGSESLSSAPAKRWKEGGKWRLRHSNSGGLAEEFVLSRDCMAVVDESTEIKNAKALRSHCAVALGQHCSFRGIGTGTDITQGIHDLYMQFYFLDPEIIGERSYYSFKGTYCIEKQVPGAKPGVMQIKGYRNIQELMDKVRPFVHQRLKKECLDLPPKTYETRIVPATPEQKKLTKELKSSMMAEWGDKKIEVRMVLDAMLRFQQIAGGFMPYWDGTVEKGKKVYKTEKLTTNPKLNELMRVLEDVSQHTKVIIWARFTNEIELIQQWLAKVFGPTSVRCFYGKTTADARREATASFQDPDSPHRFMVSNQAVGGMGQTWTAATLVIYFSDTFSYKDRLQSEDRAHRKGQEHPVTYINIRTNLPVEKRVNQVLESKGELADFADEALADIEGI